MNSFNSQILKPEQGMLELTILNAEASTASFEGVVIDALDRGIPPEIVTRLKEIWEQTKIVAGELVAVGKIIVRHIVDFIKSNPKLTIGMALGVAVGVLIGGIPFIGSLLTPLATLIATVYGGGVGVAMQNGNNSGFSFPAVIEMAQKFFDLLITIFRAVIGYFSN